MLHLNVIWILDRPFAIQPLQELLTMDNDSESSWTELDVYAAERSVHPGA